MRVRNNSLLHRGVAEQADVPVSEAGGRARRAGRLGREDGGSGVYLQYGYMKFP